MNNEFIRKSDAVEMLRARAEMAAVGTPKLVFDGASRMIERMPAADAFEVVRCMDCENWTKMHDSAQGKCWLTGDYPTGSWYCANGRKKCVDETNV